MPPSLNEPWSQPGGPVTVTVTVSVIDDSDESRTGHAGVTPARLGLALAKHWPHRAAPAAAALSLAG